MTYKSRLVTAIATGAVLLNAMASLAFADTVTLTGNGAFSNNTAALSNNTTTVVNQTNNANISNNVKSDATTGNNSADFNTGGNVGIQTGAASTNTSVDNAVNLNKATVDPCACNSGNTTINVSGNGAYSDNAAAVTNNNTVVLSQDNNANVKNKVQSDANTGGNSAGYNTGGNVGIQTGAASTNATVSTAANANIASVGGGAGAGNGGSDVKIIGNGAFSDNAAALDNNSAVVLDQTNNAYVSNDVKSKADTGNNSADFNTGGNTGIRTGDASSNASVDNMVNFNAADVSCSCLFGNGTDLKIGENGAFSDNALAATNNNDLVVGADNNANLHNDVKNKVKTGANDVSFSTGNVSGDPSILTGSSDSSTDVSNSGNVNLFNQGDLSLPGGLDLNLSFDLNSLMVGGMFHWLFM